MTLLLDIIVTDRKIEIEFVDFESTSNHFFLSISNPMNYKGPSHTLE